MEASDLETLAARLVTAKLQLPCTDHFSIFAQVVGQRSEAGLRQDLVTAARGHYRCYKLPWLWPCHLLPAIRTAVAKPDVKNCRALVDFYGAVAFLRRLVEGKQIRKDVQRWQGWELPFPVVAVAQLRQRMRSVRPTPSRHQSKDLSDVELRWAWHVWKVAEIAWQELDAKLTAAGVGKTCKQCGALMIDIKREYCSPICRRAWHNARHYQSKRASLKKREPGP